MSNPFLLGVAASFVLLLSTMPGASAAPESTANVPTLGGAAENDLTCEPMPDAAPGHFVCEDKESLHRCKALEGKGKVRVNGAKKPTPVVNCQQGG
ncbi:MAG: hypothetical protein ABI858_10065 [Pseudoxanthomonas sp.]